LTIAIHPSPRPVNYHRAPRVPGCSMASYRVCGIGAHKILASFETLWHWHVTTPTRIFPATQASDGSKFFPSRARTPESPSLWRGVAFERPVLREWRGSMSKSRFFLCSITFIITSVPSQPSSPCLACVKMKGEAVSMARLPSGLTRRVALNSAGTVWQSEKERARASTILPP
jgi:hypothetical protein